MMFGQMTAGSWIYIGSQGIVQGTYETFAEAGRQHYGGELADKWILTAGLGRHGRRAAARRDDGGRVDAGDRMPGLAHRDAPGDALPRHAGARPRSRARADRRRVRARASRSASASSAMRRKSCRSSCGAACARTWSPTRRPRTISCTAICPRAGRVERWRARAGRPGAARRTGRGSEAVDQGARRGDARLPRAGRADVRLRQQHPAGRARRGRARRVRLSGLRTRVHPSAVLRRARGRSAGSRSPATPRTSAGPTAR